MWNLELPTRMSPCVRMFIASLLDEAMPTATDEIHRLMSKRAGATVVEVKASHAMYASQPQAVAHIIEAVAKGALMSAKESGTSAAAD